MTAFQLIFVPLCGAVALLILLRMAGGTVAYRTGLLWTVLWIGAAGLIAWPQSTTRIASWLGIGRGADLVLYLATLGGLGVAIHFYARQRRLETLITEVIRRQALDAATRDQAGADSPRTRAEHD